MKFTVLKNRISIVSLLLSGFIPGFIPALFSACDAQIKDAGIGNQPEITPPRLENLLVHSLAGDPLTLNRQFNSETLNYTVPTPSTIEPVTLKAVVAAGKVTSYSIKYHPGESLTPLAGTIAVVNVLDRQSGLQANYFITFDSAELSPATINDMYLSDGTLQGEITEEEFTYTVNVTPGTPEVMVLPVGAQPNTYFTFDEGTNPVVTLEPDGTGSMVIEVMAQNYSPSSYTINFQPFSNPDVFSSSLLGITLSRGALEEPFVSDPEEDYVQKINIPDTAEDITVSAVKSVWSDSIYFDEAPSSSDYQTFSDFPSGQVFEIRVSHGGDYADRVYKFSLNKIDKPEAQLLVDGLSCSGANVLPFFYVRTPGGLDSGTGFSYEVSEYTLKYTASTGGATIAARAGEGFTISVAGRNGTTTTMSNSGKTATIAVSNLEPYLPPVEITVSGAGYIPKTYYVYFFNTNRPYRFLQQLQVIGGVQSCSPALDALQDTTMRLVSLYANTTMVIVRGTAAAGSVITYDPPGGYLYNTIHNQAIYVTVSGGPGYQDSKYKLHFTVQQTPQSPYLTSLKINETELHSSGRLVYEYTIESDGAGALSVPFDWTYNANEVNRISVSLDGGSSWSPASGFASPPNISLNPLESKVVLIKVRTFDSNEAVYYVTVRRTSALQLTTLQIVDVDNSDASLFETASSFSPAVFYYPITAPNGTGMVKIMAAATPGAEVRAVQNGLPYTVGAPIPLYVCEPVTVTLSIYPLSAPNQAAASYNFVITRERPAGFYMGTNTTPICALPEEAVMQPPDEDEELVEAAEVTEVEEPVVPVPVETLAGALTWLSANAESGRSYTLILGNPEASPPVTLDGLSFDDTDNITFTLGAVNAGTIVSLTGTGALFTVGTGVNFILDRNIHLQGVEENTSSVVYLDGNVGDKCRPTLEMKEGSKISGNSLSVFDYGGGITMDMDSAFTMRGGEISGNTAITGGGGIYSPSTIPAITIYGGLITQNTALEKGGGIALAHTFQMYGGVISNNSASEGGGLYVLAGGAVTITGGSILLNNASYDEGNGGGGIFITSSGSAAFSGGRIADNITASALKPGSFNVSGIAQFTNTSGQTITGVD